MATVADTLAAISSKLATLTSGTRMTSDTRRDLEAIAPGATKFQMRHSVNTIAEDANQDASVVELDVEVHRYLSGSESSYTAGAMVTYQDSLSDDTTGGWWLAISQIRAILDGPTTSEARRVGNVVSFSVKLSFSVEPT